MVIESCDNADKHDEHYWQPHPNMRASNWCPGAAGAPKPPKWVVTAHSGGGSMGEAMQPSVAVLCPDEATANTLNNGIQAILSAKDPYGDWLVVSTPVEEFSSLPTIPVVNGVVTDPYSGKQQKVDKGQVAVDLWEFIKSWHEDIEP